MPSPAEVAGLFAPGGPLARARDRFEHRAGQERMAGAVARAFAEGRHLVVEAGTGTGKTLAYLVPALLADEPVDPLDRDQGAAGPAARARAADRARRDRGRARGRGPQGTGELPLPETPRGAGDRAAARPRGRGSALAAARRLVARDGDRRPGRDRGPARRLAALVARRRPGRDLHRHEVPALRRLLRLPRAARRCPRPRGRRQPPPAVRRPGAAPRRARRGVA